MRRNIILVVDDNPNNLRLLHRVLQEAGYKVYSANSGSYALSIIEQEQPNLILLDIRMPNMNGFEVCKHLKGDPKTKDIPIIFISALDEAADKVHALKIGGIDYVTKPFQVPEVLARVKNQLDLQQAQKALRSLNTNLEDKVQQRTTQLEKTLQQALENQRKFEVLFNSIMEGIIIINQQGMIENINPAVERMFGYRLQALLGQNVEQLMLTPYQQKSNDYLTPYKPVNEHIHPIIGQGKDLYGMRQDGSTFPLEVNVTKLQLDQSLKFVSVIRDITARKEAQKRIQQAYQGLIEAYDQTLSGWVQALELRDAETKGHSERVTRLTLKLARLMEISEDKLIHIKRGALLHDIGKMAIPDNILLKPGKLTPEEWEIMKQHPLYAQQMLDGIAYLTPALDIPLYHHEKWDGTGYPYGLMGEDIPLSARIFAIVDVFDALTSKRPYHEPIPKKEAITYIKQQKGQHFDPQVVEIFLSVMSDTTASEEIPDKVAYLK